MVQLVFLWHNFFPFFFWFHSPLACLIPFLGVRVKCVSFGLSCGFKIRSVLHTVEMQACRHGCIHAMAAHPPPTLAEIEYAVALAPIMRTSLNKPSKAEVSSLPNPRGPTGKEPIDWLEFQCGDHGYGPNENGEFDPRCLKEVLSIELDPTRCFMFRRPRTLLPVGDDDALASAARKDRSIRVLNSALSEAQESAMTRSKESRGTMVYLKSCVDIALTIIRGCHFAGRSLWAVMRRHFNRPLKRRDCPNGPLVWGGRAPDMPAPCLACDLLAGNVCFALLGHETFYFSFKDFDCSINAPTLAVSYIDGLAVAAAFQAGRVTDDQVHRIVSVMAEVSIRDVNGGHVPDGAGYNVRALDVGPGAECATMSPTSIMSMVESMAGQFAPTAAQRAMEAACVELLADLGGGAASARALLRSVVQQSVLVIDPDLLRACAGVFPTASELAHRHSVTSGLTSRGLLYYRSLNVRQEARIGVKYSLEGAAGIHMRRAELRMYFYSLADKIIRVRTGDYPSFTTILKLSPVERDTAMSRATPRVRTRAQLLAECARYPDIAWARSVALSVCGYDPIGAEDEDPPTQFDFTGDHSNSTLEVEAERIAVYGCATCGGKGKLFVCSRCRLLVYCSVECQRAHWGAHKPTCNEIAKVERKSTMAAEGTK